VESRVEGILDQKPPAVGVNRLHDEVIERAAQRSRARAEFGSGQRGLGSL